MHICDQDGNGGCEVECEKVGKEAKCGCKEGFTLNKNGKDCDKSKWTAIVVFGITADKHCCILPDTRL